MRQSLHNLFTHTMDECTVSYVFIRYTSSSRSIIHYHNVYMHQTGASRMSICEIYMRCIYKVVSPNLSNTWNLSRTMLPYHFSITNLHHMIITGTRHTNIHTISDLDLSRQTLLYHIVSHTIV